MSPLRQTTKSTRVLADELTRQGHWVGAGTVGDLLRAEGFSLQGLNDGTRCTATFTVSQPRRYRPFRKGITPLDAAFYPLSVDLGG